MNFDCRGRFSIPSPLAILFLAVGIYTMTKTNFLNNIGAVNFNISYDAEQHLTSILCNEIELLNLAGGIPGNGINDILQSVEYTDINNSLSFSSESKLFVIERELFWDNKFIDNKLLIVFATGRGIGTYIFINEIIQARKLGIACLKASAAKSERFNGYLLYMGEIRLFY